jgi:hypothetical protein
MAIASTGAVSASDIRTEYGLSGAVSFSDLYRGGTHVRAKAANNNGTNLASSVPTSGAITFGNFRGTAKGFRYTFTAGATDQNASALFGSDYGVNYPKEIVIDSGVELGATSTSEEALEIDSGGAGTITVTNNGTLSGAGGAAGADGGDAFEAAVTCTFVNNGTVRAGGGGGGVGGDGSYTSQSEASYCNLYTVNSVRHGSGDTFGWHRNSATIKVTRSCSELNGTYSYGGKQYRMGGVCAYGGSSCGKQAYHYIIEITNVTNNTTGGAGGVGTGYNQSSGTGVAGGTNAGTGGDGGGYGASGTTGTNGTSTNGSGGGAAGKYLRGSSFVTFTNNGTAQGGTA